MPHSASTVDNPEFRFRIPAEWNLNSYQLGLVHVIGLDGTPWPCKVRLDQTSTTAADGPIVHVARNQSESGHVYFQFPHPQHGDLLLSTGTLPVSEQPYPLLRELARGTLNRLRNQLSIWHEGGLAIPVSVTQILEQGIHSLAQAIMIDEPAEQDRLASEAIELGVNAIFVLGEHFGQHIGRYRCENEDLPNFWLAATVPTAADETVKRFSGCDYFRIVPSQLDVAHSLSGTAAEHAAGCSTWTHGLSRPLVLGPWLDASQGGMPEALLQLGDHLERRKAILMHLRTSLETLPEQVHLLHLACGLNGIGHRHLSYPQQFQLASDMLQMAENSLVEVPVMVSFDFPWAERLASAVGGIHPLQIADSLLRQGAEINYFGLEINLDYWPGGSAIRDPFQWIDLIDIWAQLEVPLVLLLRTPIGGAPVPGDQPVDRLVNQPRSRTNDQQRLEFLKVVLPMMVARPTVHGLIWPQWQDGSDSRFPHGGLVDALGNPKLSSALLSNLRSSILMGD